MERHVGSQGLGQHSKMPMAISGARRSGQAGGSLPSRGQPRLELSCKCPHPPPEGEESRPYARLGVRSAAPHRFRVGPCPAGWSSQPYRARHRLKQQSRLRPETEAQKNQSDPCRAIDCARATHVSSLLPATLSLPVIAHTEIAHTVDRTSVKYPRSREKRRTTMPVGAYRLPPHGPHADQMEGSLFLSMEYN